MITRRLSLSDRNACYHLWQERFDDSVSFATWFFDNRFSPAHSAGTFDGDTLVSMSLGYPMPLTSPCGDAPAWMLSGVSTRAGYEKTGLMHRTVRFQMDLAHDSSVPVVFNRPVHLHQYDSLGFCAITNTLFYASAVPPCESVTLTLCTPCEDDMLALYNAMCSDFCACVRRDRRLFSLKMQDYLADGAVILGVSDGNRLRGYSAVLISDAVVSVEEAVADNAYAALLSAVHALADGRRVEAKLPPSCGIAGEIRPQNVAAFTDPEDKRDIQQFFRYRSQGTNCYAVDEY